VPSDPAIGLTPRWGAACAAMSLASDNSSKFHNRRSFPEFHLQREGPSRISQARLAEVLATNAQQIGCFRYREQTAADYQ
jgi:hypothetical protein